MSPRKNNVITIESWPKLKPGGFYQGRVKKAHVEKVSNSLRVTIENLDPTQLGRIHEMDLPLPARPGNRVCLFLVACGINAAAAGTTICLDQIANAVVGMRFRGTAANGSEEFDFEKIPDSSTTEPDSSNKEQTRPAKSSDDDAVGAARAKGQTW